VTWKKNTTVELLHKGKVLVLSVYILCLGGRGGALEEALRYKPEGRGIDSRWYHWNFSLT
jgi:hypothetical protein